MKLRTPGLTPPVPQIPLGALGVPLIALLLALLAFAPRAEARAPNIVVVTTDDQTLAAMNEQTMPFTSRFFAEGGTEFTNGVVVSPSCCPSRAAFLTGQYPHNNRVFNNNPGYRSLRHKRTTLPVWLEQAGYLTAHVGKFLNRYGDVNGWATPAPGFKRWYTLATYRYYGYRLATNRGVRQFGDEGRDYLTRRLNQQAGRFLERASKRPRPFYLQLDQFAPHSETGQTPGPCEGAAQPDPLDVGLFADAEPPQTALDPDERSYNEEDVSDKSPVIAALRYRSPYVLSNVAKRYRCQLAALRGVDRGFERIYRTLFETRSLRRTAILFTSDNGFFFAEHRIPNDKGFPYEEGIRVPLLARLPPSMQPDPPASLDQPVSNIDLTATLVELARAEPCNALGKCRRLDGRSLLGLLTGSDSSWPEDRRILIEQGRGTYFCAPYSAAWNPASLLIEYPTEEPGKGCTPEYEYYEMDIDPMQLENRYPASPGTSRAAHQAELLGVLAGLRRCSGISGRDPDLPARPPCE